MNLPEHIKYTPTHEWVMIFENEASIGLSKQAVDLLGDIVYLELPKVGAQVVQHKTIGFVESVKAASEIYSPLSGMVVAVNEDLIRDPGLLNRDCYGKGWLYRIVPSNLEESSPLLTPDAYQASLG